MMHIVMSHTGTMKYELPLKAVATIMYNAGYMTKCKTDYCTHSVTDRLISLSLFATCVKEQKNNII